MILSRKMNPPQNSKILLDILLSMFYRRFFRKVIGYHHLFHQQQLWIHSFNINYNIYEIVADYLIVALPVSSTERIFLFVEYFHRLTSSFLGPEAAAALILHSFRKPKRVRTAFTPAQLLKLENAFEKNHYVVGQERKELARHLNLTETQVS